MFEKKSHKSCTNKPPLSVDELKLQQLLDSSITYPVWEFHKLLKGLKIFNIFCFVLYGFTYIYIFKYVFIL